METMPYREGLALDVVRPGRASVPATVTPTDWRDGLPVLTGAGVTLRELRPADAASLFALLTTEEVARFISPPPSTVEAFAQFIDWAQRQRAAGTYACFAVTLHGADTAIGIFQIRGTAVAPGAAEFDTAEWGFAIGAPFWGTGVFQDGAAQLLAFAFDTLHVRRLEARAAVQNGRGTGALLKMGAVQEAVLRQSFVKNGRTFNQVLFAILAHEWHRGRDVPPPPRRARVH
jgi:RimJ/RimL family protein N-acetyltransferase